MPVKSYQTLPTLDQWKRDSGVALAIRNNEPGLKRIDELVMRIGQGTNHVETYGPLLIDLFLSINYWFAGRKDRPGRVHEGRLPAMRALFAFVVDQLKPLMVTSSDSNPTAMSIGKTIAEMTAVSMDSHGYVADSDFNMRAFSKEQLRQYRLEFNGGLAYQVEWWRPRPLRWSAPADSARFAPNGPRLANAGKSTPNAAPFIMDLNRRIYMTHHDRDGGIFHSSYNNGAPVVMAGTIVIVKGKITTVRLDSGHYAPGADNLPAFLMALRMYGVNLRDIRLLDYKGLKVGGIDVSAERVLEQGTSWKMFVANAVRDFERQLANQSFEKGNRQLGWEQSNGVRGPNWDARDGVKGPTLSLNGSPYRKMKPMTDLQADDIMDAIASHANNNNNSGPRVGNPPPPVVVMHGGQPVVSSQIIILNNGLVAENIDEIPLNRTTHLKKVVLTDHVKPTALVRKYL